MAAGTCAGLTTTDWESGTLTGPMVGSSPACSLTQGRSLVVPGSAARTCAGLAGVRLGSRDGGNKSKDSNGFPHDSHGSLLVRDDH